MFRTTRLMFVSCVFVWFFKSLFFVLCAVVREGWSGVRVVCDSLGCRECQCLCMVEQLITLHQTSSTINQPDIKTGRYEAFTRKWSLLLYQEQGRVLICSRCGCGRTKPCEADTHTHTHKVECWPPVAMAA